MNILAFSDGHGDAVKRVELFGASEPIRKRWCNDNQPHDLERR